MTSPLTQSALDTMGCGTPDCGHDHTVLYLLSICHPKTGLEASYDKRTGVLTLRCKLCKKETGAVVVADGSVGLNQ